MVNRPTDDELEAPFVPVAGQAFESKQDWIARASRVLTSHPEYHNTEHDGPAKGWRGNHFTALCYDQKGRRVRNGGDFRRAEEDDAYPVWWVWPDQIAAMLRACKGRVDDDEIYQIGVRDGYEKAIQELDVEAGGDGEFFGSTIPGETVDVPAMKARILAALEPAPDHSEWNAAIEAAQGQRGLWLQFDTQGEIVGWCTVEPHDPGGMTFYVNRDAIRTLKKGPDHE